MYAQIFYLEFNLKHKQLQNKYRIFPLSKLSGHKEVDLNIVKQSSTNLLLYSTILRYTTLQYSNPNYSTRLYSTRLYSTPLYSTPLYSTPL